MMYLSKDNKNIKDNISCYDMFVVDRLDLMTKNHEIMDLVKKDLVTIDLVMIGPVMVRLAKINLVTTSLVMAARMAWRTTYAAAVNDIKENKK
jgi:hypothetical protein